MKQSRFYLLLLLSIYASCTNAQERSIFVQRSQGVNAARKIAGWQTNYINLFEPAHDFYGTLSVAVEYNRSYNACAFSNYLFGTNQLNFSGSCISNRDPKDLLADYFGLPGDYKGSVSFKPRTQNAIIDFNWYMGFDVGSGLYFTIDIPVTWSAWQLCMRQKIDDAGVKNYPAGYMDSQLTKREDLPKNAIEALSGAVTWGNMQPMNFGAFSACEQHKTGIAELRASLGYNIFNYKRGYLGLSLLLAVPTNKYTDPRFIFAPEIGNGRHVEIGAGATGHALLWQSECKQSAIAFFADLAITHLCTAHQKRSYDLCNGALSRYMLIEEMGHPVIEGLQLEESPGNYVDAQQQYHAVIMPAINQTTLESDINIAMQADFACKLSFQHKRWNVDLGYNLWARSAEKIYCRQRLAANRYAIKGDAQLYGFGATTIPDRYIGLNATQHEATIHAGQGTGNVAFLNQNADNAAHASFLPDPTDPLSRDLLVQSTIAGAVGSCLEGVPLSNVFGSKQAIMLTDDDINVCSGLAPAALSNKFFMHIDYAWKHDGCITPYLGLGGEIEVGSHTTTKTALSQWGVWLKGGFAY